MRPQRLEEIVGQPETVSRLERLVSGVRAGRIVPPHLLFHGPPGVGKTTAARAFARAVLGMEWENGFSELRAHDNRSAEFLKNRLIPESRRPPLRGAPFRILFLDEVDALTPEAFVALRPALEADEGRSVFVLACNEIERLPEPLVSRCAVFPFRPLSEGEMGAVVARAVERLGVGLAPERVSSIAVAARGVPRNAVKLLLEELA